MMKVKENIIHNPEIECMDREELKKIQLERLKETVKLCYDNVPMYKQRMDENGVKPEDIKELKDIAKLPFTYKTDLRDEFPFGLFAADKKDIVRIQGSSGTTGKPIVSGYTENDVEIWTEIVARSLAAAGCDKEDIVQIAYGYGLFTGGLGAHQGATRRGAMTVPMSSGNTQRQIMMMKELGATMLCCTPSYAIYLGESIKELGYDIKDFKLKSGCFGAEPWTEEMREQLEGLMDINAYNIYGLTEMGGPGVAFECPEKCGMHINEDHFIAEIINPETGEPLPYGEEGELVFTTITKTGMPLLRYRTRDICTLYEDKCKCGRTHARMSRIFGRSDDMMIIRGVNVFPSQIEGVLLNVEGVSPHYMIVIDRVNSTDQMEVQVELTEEFYSDKVSEIEKIRETIKNQIKSDVGISAKIKLVPPKSIPRSEGKAKRIIDNRNIK
ncbi:MAG: phenylacetate--CoA ligase [Ruminococcaceae bacterium]|nr:phenylacetate--CoA ligase [Oscillospiraceae bacterium]